MSVIHAPTNTVWLVVRIVVKNDKDLPNAKKLLNQITLSSLHGRVESLFSKSPKGTPQDVQKAGIEFFDELSEALIGNEPPQFEKKLLEKFGTIGIAQGKKPSKQTTDSQLKTILNNALQEGEKQIDKKIKELAKPKNGWFYDFKTGHYGNDYLLRAAIAKQGLGANIPAEALYAAAFTDKSGSPLIGSKRYTIHFDKNQIPPVNAFWSLTLYDSKTKQLVANPFNRYAVGDRSNFLQYNTDGSLDIYIQNSIPKENVSNWLPAPKGSFYLILRMYMPKKEVLNDTYQYPSIIVRLE